MRPILKVYHILKDDDIGIKVYKSNVADEHKHIPTSYIVIRSGIVDSAKVRGDGQTLLRNTIVDICLISSTNGTNETDIFNKNKTALIKRLWDYDIKYDMIDLGYDYDQHERQCIFTINVQYVRSDYD